jgi:predicted nucleic acid-binding protein
VKPKVFADSSVLVAAILESHPWHARALPLLKRVQGHEVDLWVAAHSLAETYAVLTAFPTRPRVVPIEAWTAIEDGVLSEANVVALTAADYVAALRWVAERGLPGGVVYDAIIVQAARKSGADRILTFDVDDFRRVWPEGADRISAP